MRAVGPGRVQRTQTYKAGGFLLFPFLFFFRLQRPGRSDYKLAARQGRSRPSVPPFCPSPFSPLFSFFLSLTSGRCVLVFVRKETRPPHNWGRGTYSPGLRGPSLLTLFFPLHIRFRAREVTGWTLERGRRRGGPQPRPPCKCAFPSPHPLSPFFPPHDSSFPEIPGIDFTTGGAQDPQFSLVFLFFPFFPLLPFHGAPAAVQDRPELVKAAKFVQGCFNAPPVGFCPLFSSLFLIFTKAPVVKPACTSGAVRRCMRAGPDRTVLFCKPPFPLSLSFFPFFFLFLKGPVAAGAR